MRNTWDVSWEYSFTQELIRYINKTGEICKDQNTDDMLIYQELEKYLRKYANKYMIMEML